MSQPDRIRMSDAVDIVYAALFLKTSHSLNRRWGQVLNSPVWVWCDGKTFAVRVVKADGSTADEWRVEAKVGPAAAALRAGMEMLGPVR